MWRWAFTVLCKNKQSRFLRKECMFGRYKRGMTHEGQV